MHSNLTNCSSIEYLEKNFTIYRYLFEPLMKPQVMVLAIGIAILKKKSKTEKCSDGWTDQWAEDGHQMIKRVHLNIWIKRHSNQVTLHELLNTQSF